MFLLLIKNLMLVGILLCWYCADRVLFRGSTLAFLTTLLLMVGVDLLFEAFVSRRRAKSEIVSATDCVD